MTKEFRNTIEELGWSISNHGDYYELENSSPAGEDLIVTVSGRNDEELYYDVSNLSFSFDADEHAYNWYGKNRGEPSSLQALLDDAYEISRMYDELRDSLYLVLYGDPMFLC